MSNYAMVGAPLPTKGMVRTHGAAAARPTGAPKLPPMFEKLKQLHSRLDAQGRQVVKIPKADLARFLMRRAYMGEAVERGVGAPAQTPYDNARVLIIENLAAQGVLFEVAEGVDGLIAEIYEATPRQMPDAEVAGLFSGLKKAVKKIGGGIAKAAKSVVKIATPLLKKVGAAALSVGGVVAGVALGGPIIGTIAKFGGSLLGKAAGAVGKLLGGGAAAEPQPADPASPTNVPEQLFATGQKVYVAEASILFDGLTPTVTQEQLKTIGKAPQGTEGVVTSVFTHPSLGQFYMAMWGMAGGPTTAGWIHQSMLSANLVPPAGASGTKPTSEEMDALTAQLAQLGQKNPDALAAAQALAQTRELVGKTSDQAIAELQKSQAEDKGAQMVTEGQRVEPGQIFMLDAYIGVPVIGAYVDGRIAAQVGAMIGVEVGGQDIQLRAKTGEGGYIVNDRDSGIHGGYTPAYDDGTTAILGRSKSGRENPLPDWVHKLDPAAISQVRDDEGGAAHFVVGLAGVGRLAGAPSQPDYQADAFDEMNAIVAADAVEIKPGQKVQKGTVYKASVPIVIKNGKAVHADLVKRIITNKWTWVGLGSAVLLGVGTGVAVKMARKKPAVGARVRRRR